MALKQAHSFRQRYRSDCPSPEPINERRTFCKVEIPSEEKGAFVGVVISQKRTKSIDDMSPKHRRSPSPSGKPKKKTKVVAGRKNRKLSISSDHASDMDMVPGVMDIGYTEVEQKKPKTPARRTTKPEYSYPRLDRRRKQGKPDNAAGPSYAIHDTSTEEIIGDTRAEMPYLAIDKEITDAFNELWNSINTLSLGHFSSPILNDKKQEWLQSFPKSLQKKRKRDLEFVHLVNQICVGGPCGVGSWEELFLEPELRRGVVCGIIWRKLEREVFGKMLFGGTRAQERELMKIEEGMREDSEGL
jgi:hypothetical protein